MTTDSGKKPAKEWKILNGRLIQDINGFKQEIAMAVHQDRLDEIQGESTLVREVTPCANCERLEASKHIQTSGMETEIQRLQKQLEMCKEALGFYANHTKFTTLGDFFRLAKLDTTARECLKAIDKDG